MSAATGFQRIFGIIMKTSCCKTNTYFYSQLICIVCPQLIN